MIDPCKSDVDRMHEDLKHLRRLSALAPNDPDTRLAFARKLLDCRKADEAILEIRAVIAMVPNHLEARKLLESAHELQLSGRTST
jgi:predicted Zn-dependent protease